MKPDELSLSAKLFAASKETRPIEVREFKPGEAIYFYCFFYPVELFVFQITCLESSVLKLPKIRIVTKTPKTR